MQSRHSAEQSAACAQVDILSWRNKTQRVHVQVKDICAILSGLVVAQDYKKGQALVVNRNFADNAEWFQASCSSLQSTHADQKEEEVLSRHV
jgi:hypothetical protein